MKLKKVIKLEKKAKQVWIVSPDLHYDTENDTFKNIVKHNLHSNTEYRYIVPNTRSVRDHLKAYIEDLTIPKNLYKKMFLVLPKSEMTPFLNELAIYNPNGKNPVACLSIWRDADEDDEVIRFDKKKTKVLVKRFDKVWKKHKS